MIFSEHKFDPDYIAGLVKSRETGLKQNRGVSDLLGFGLGVVVQRLAKSPSRYLDYGPYWWASKDVLRDQGYAVGDQTDPLVAREYKGDSPVGTLIAADEFRSQYLATQMVGANQHLLNAQDGEWYVLFDPDMEGRLTFNNPK